VPRFLIMDELHIQITTPLTSSEKDRAAIRRRLISKQFRRQVVHAVRALFASTPTATTVRVRLVR
jgi:hypothetical protein